MTTHNSKMSKILQGLIKDVPAHAKLEIKSGHHKVRLYLVTVPVKAGAEVLEHCNIGNRKIRQSVVARMSADMQAGLWRLQNTLVFLDDGRLFDGQHRLLAMRDAGLGITFLVQIIPAGDAPQASRVQDTGTQRNVADFLHFNGVDNAYRIAGVLRYERNFRVTGNPFQVAEGDRLEFLALYEELGPELCKRAFDAVPRGAHTALGIKKAVVDWFALQAVQSDPEAAGLFLQYVLEPEHLGKTDPMFLLHQRLKDMMIKRATKAMRISLVDQAASLIKAWNLHYEGQKATATKLKYRANEDWPVMFGVHK